MKIITCLLLTMFSANSVFAETIVRLAPGQSENDTRHIYPHKILRLAMDATIETDGPYEIVYSKENFTRNRALIALQTGQMINVHEAPTRDDWEKGAIPVYIPVRKGLLGYRLLLIDKSSEATFKNIESADQLKKLYAGLEEQWSITKIMKTLGFNVVTGNNYEGLFGMLAARRFDYFSRGLNEVFPEYAERKSKYPEMIIESSIAIYIPSPTYFFVSPAYPELADRIEKGMHSIIKDGTFELAFNQEFGDYIKSANLARRKVFTFDNPLLSDKTPINNSKYWFQNQ